MLLKEIHILLDCFALTETWLLDSKADQFNIDDHVLFTNQHPFGNKGSDVCIYVNQYNSSVITMSSSHESFEYLPVNLKFLIRKCYYLCYL